MIKPYEGDKPYIFISYSHENSVEVMPIIERLIADGYRVWYDKGIKATEEYNEYIAKHINKCRCFISMITPEYFESYYCKKELKYSIRKNKQQYPIYLSKTVLPDEFDMHIGDIQAVFKYECKNDSSFYDKLYSAEILTFCKEENNNNENLEEDKTPAETIAAPPKKKEKKPRKSYRFFSKLKKTNKNTEKDEKNLSESKAKKKFFEKIHIPKAAIIASLIFLLVLTSVILHFCLRPRMVFKDNGDGTSTLIDIKGIYSKNIIIPEYSPSGDKVTYIGEDAFASCTRLTSITIPDSVTSIGDDAFYNCRSLTSITIPDSVTSIGYFAFFDCSSLTSVTIPDSVTSIGNYAFDGCPIEKATIPAIASSSLENSRLKEIIITSGTSIGYAAFDGCSSLTSVTIPDSVTSIGGNAFYNCSSLTSITIPDSVTSIGGNAFYNCRSLKSITIPDSVTYIGDDAFLGCSRLTSITLPFVGAAKDADDYDKRVFTYIFGGHFGDVPKSLKTVVITGGNYIGYNAFSDCTSLTSITIPDSVTSISDSAFDYCTSLTSITIPDSVTSIGGYAFENCTSLTNVTIPDSVTYIGDEAFRSCDSLTDIYFNGTITEWNAIFKGGDWDRGTPSYTVHCTDGDITK